MITVTCCVKSQYNDALEKLLNEKPSYITNKTINRLVAKAIVITTDLKQTNS